MENNQTVDTIKKRKNNDQTQEINNNNKTFRKFIINLEEQKRYLKNKIRDQKIIIGSQAIKIEDQEAKIENLFKIHYEKEIIFKKLQNSEEYYQERMEFFRRKLFEKETGEEENDETAYEETAYEETEYEIEQRILSKISNKLKSI